MPGRLRSFYSGPRKIVPGRKSPIRIPQNPTRPIKLHRRDQFRRDLTRPTRSFFVHRRGPRHTNVGQDPNEARAIPKSSLKGTLPERIIYKFLVEKTKEEFTFQSSIDGGRLELGGIVADFILTFRMIILNPTGPTHDTVSQKRRDDEQRMTLEQMGYRVFFIPEADVLNEYVFEGVMRSILDLGIQSDSLGAAEAGNDFSLDQLYDRLTGLLAKVKAIQNLGAQQYVLGQALQPESVTPLTR